MIYGSCVSRDMVEAVKPKGIKLLNYAARQSWCSVGNNADQPHLAAQELPSAFETRNYQGDLRGDALHRIISTARRHPTMTLLMDLTDERGGFFRCTDGGVITNTYDSPAADIIRSAPGSWQPIPFGSLEHFLSFADAAQVLKDGLTKADLFGRTLLIQNLWAERTAKGEPTGVSFGLSASEANIQYAEYFELLREMGWQVVSPASNTPVADPQHRWGEAPFHYTDEYYHTLWQTLEPRLPNVR
ncbi:DUF6270 domain-containing protein [Actinomycetaceae bacterium MB13-C1-2]|nr:DUF6270 domain-containing protein [Actinomycetaceae bacterium MB13-C1-2]